MTRLPSPIVLIGYGDIARRLAQRLPERDIVAIARQQPEVPTGHRGRWTGVAADLDTDSALPDDVIPAGAIWVYLAPPPRQGVSDTRVARWLEAAHENPAAVVYIGTTGVYGDQKGAWVDEQVPSRPGHDRGRRRLDAERQFTAWCAARHVPLTCLRVTGIYACDRLPLERLRAGTPVPVGLEAPWSNRIHADDLVDILWQLIARTEADRPISGIFNVSDNQPAPVSRVYRHIAAHFHLPPPPEAPLETVLAQSSPMAREFLSESRRIDATAIQRALDWQPRYPDIDATLAACEPSDD